MDEATGMKDKWDLRRRGSSLCRSSCSIPCWCSISKRCSWSTIRRSCWCNNRCCLRFRCESKRCWSYTRNWCYRICCGWASWIQVWIWIFFDPFIFHVHMSGKSGTSLIFTSLEHWISCFDYKGRSWRKEIREWFDFTSLKDMPFRGKSERSSYIYTNVPLEWIELWWHGLEERSHLTSRAISNP